MTRRLLRGFLLASLFLSAAFAVWIWFRPYEWNADPASRGKILEVHVRKDHSYYWVDVRMKPNDGQSHDFSKPVFLITANGGKLEAADTTLIGDEGHGATEVWFKFWLESSEMEGPLTLRINDGKLVVKAKSGMPDFGGLEQRAYATNHW